MTQTKLTLKPRLIELPIQLYRLFIDNQNDPATPRIYAIGAHGYMVDYDQFKAWKPPEKPAKNKR
jgi:hypothetical protein